MRRNSTALRQIKGKAPQGAFLISAFDIEKTFY